MVAFVGRPQRTPYLVGREREQAVIDERLDQLFAGHGGLLLLGGAAGISKIILARDLERRSAERGALVVTGHCYDLTTTPPYGPWRELLAQLATTADATPRIDGSQDDVTADALYARVRAGHSQIVVARHTRPAHEVEQCMSVLVDAPSQPTQFPQPRLACPPC